MRYYVDPGTVLHSVALGAGNDAALFGVLRALQEPHRSLQRYSRGESETGPADT